MVFVLDVDSLKADNCAPVVSQRREVELPVEVVRHNAHDTSLPGTSCIININIHIPHCGVVRDMCSQYICTSLYVYSY